MPVVELTDRHCRTKAVPGQQIELVDSLVRGLVLRISGGRDIRAWRFHFRYRGKRGWLALGHFPEVTLSAARDKARAARGKLADDIDPGAPEPADQQMTVGALIESFLVRHAAKKKTGREMRRRLERNVTPFIGSIPVGALHRRDVTAVVDRVKDRGALTESNRTLEDLQSCLNWAVDRGDLENNPAARMRKLPMKPRERSLSTDEIRLMWQRLPSAPMGEDVRNAIRLCLVTGQRVGEIVGMRRSEIDFGTATWNLPGERVKNGRAHSVPLTPMALGIIAQQLTPDTEFVFPGRRGNPHLLGAGVPHALSRGPAGEKTKTTLGLPAFSPHDLRRTFATHLIEMGVLPATVEACLNHVSGSRSTVLGRHYNRHGYSSEMRAAMMLWDAKLQEIIGR